MKNDLPLIPSSEITPESVFHDRRRVLAALGATALGATALAGGSSSAAAPAAAAKAAPAKPLASGSSATAPAVAAPAAALPGPTPGIGVPRYNPQRDALHTGSA